MPLPTLQHSHTLLIGCPKSRAAFSWL